MDENAELSFKNYLTRIKELDCISLSSKQKCEIEIACQEFLKLEGCISQEAYLEAIVFFRDRKFFDLADSIVCRGVELFGETYALLVCNADTAVDACHWREAVKRFEKIKHLFPNEPYAFEKIMLLWRVIGDKPQEAQAHMEFVSRFGAQPLDALTYVMINDAAKKTTKLRRICFVSGDMGFVGHSKYLFLTLSRKSQLNRVEVYWIADNVDEYQALILAGYSCVYWSSSPENCKLLLGASIVIYQTHDLTVSGSLRQACSSQSIKVQLWHGIPAKVVGYESLSDESTVLIENFAKLAHDCHRYDYIITESINAEEAYSSAFPNCKLIPLGGCRLDSLSKENPYELHEMWLGMRRTPDFDLKKKYILYAPTYRERTQDVQLFLLAVRELSIELSSKDDLVLIVKPHPRMIQESGIDFRKVLENLDNIIFLDERDDIYPWANLADYLITDYSSVYYDYLVTGKPIIFFRPDELAYYTTRSKMEYEIESEHPAGPIITDAKNLLNNLHCAEEIYYQSNRNRLASNFHNIDEVGLISEKVSKFVISLLVED